jgi:DNA polymerase-3 subunit epsilon
MRQIVLDTETTGLSWEKGNRVVEIGCVELVERRPTGRTFQRYLDPECDFEPGAQEVTGLTREFLAGKPKFADVVEEFLEFIEGAELVIHNAAFDLGFLDAELSRLGRGHAPLRQRCSVEDSLDLARQRFPGQRNSLDALCRRLGVDNSHRQLHGALLDAQLLAEAYLALTAGQGEIGFDALANESVAAVVAIAPPADGAAGARPRVVASAEELDAHAARLAQLRKKAGGAAIWDRLADAGAAGGQGDALRMEAALA